MNDLKDEFSPLYTPPEPYEECAKIARAHMATSAQFGLSHPACGNMIATDIENIGAMRKRQQLDRARPCSHCGAVGTWKKPGREENTVLCVDHQRCWQRANGRSPVPSGCAPLHTIVVSYPSALTKLTTATINGYGRPITATGLTSDAAIANLIRENPTLFNIEIVELPAPGVGVEPDEPWPRE